MSGAAPPPRPRACPNCGEVLLPRAAGQWPAFCPACGQETRVQAPTLAEFAQQFGGAYLSTEGALWRTLALLLFKPGELTRRYLAGRRKHYVLPLRLYLSISVLVLLLLRVVATVGLDGPDAARVDAGEKMNLKLHIGAGRTGMRDGVFFCEDLPAWLCQRVQRRVDVKPEALVGVVRQLGERFLANLGAALFVLLPSFALFLKLAYLGRRLRYTEHLVFALHVHAFWFLMVGLSLLPLGGLPPWALLAVPVYTLLAMKRVYGGGLGWRLLRALAVSLLYGITLALAMAGVGLWAFLA